MKKLFFIATAALSLMALTAIDTPPQAWYTNSELANKRYPITSIFAIDDLNELGFFDRDDLKNLALNREQLDFLLNLKEPAGIQNAYAQIMASRSSSKKRAHNVMNNIYSTFSPRVQNLIKLQVKRAQESAGNLSASLKKDSDDLLRGMHNLSMH